MKKFARLFGLIAAAAVSAVVMGCNTNKTVTVAPVTFDPVSGTAIKEGSSVTLTTTDLDNDEDINIYYSTDVALTADNYEEEGKEYSSGIKVSEDCTIYAIAVNDSGVCSAGSSATYTVKHVPNAVAFTASAEATDGLYARGTTVTLTASSSIDNDTVTIYYSTSETLTRDNYEEKGTVYSSAITVNDYTVISAVAANANGASVVSTGTFDVPTTYNVITDTVNCGIDGNIDDVIAAVNGATDATTFDATTVTGVVTSVYSGKYMIVQDNNGAIEFYKSTITSDLYSVGDIVQIPNCTSGQVYNGLIEVTAFGDPVVTGKTRNVYFKKISNLCTDFTPFASVNGDVYTGNIILYGIRGKTEDYAAVPTLIYSNGVIKNTASTESITLGYVVSFKGTIEMSPVMQVTSDLDSIMELDVPVVANVKASVTSGSTVEADSTVELTCETADTTIYYSTTDKTASGIIANGTAYSSAITIADDMTIYTVAKDGDGNVSAVVTLSYYTPWNTTYAELPATLADDDAYNFDGGLSALRTVIAGYTSATEITNDPVSGILVMYGSGKAGNYYLIQDKNAAVYCYGISLPGNARVGSKITLTPTKVQNRYGGYQISAASNVTVTTPKCASKIYYQNLSGLDDFTSYVGNDKLCACRGLKADYPYSNGSKAYLYSYNSSYTLPTTEQTFFGYTYTYSNTDGTTTYTELCVLYYADADTVSYPASYVATPTFSTSGEVEAGTAVTLSCGTTGATVYYQWIAADDETTKAITAADYSAATAGTSYTVNAAGTLYAIAVNGDYTSKVVSADYTIKASNSETISLASNSWGLVTANTTGGGDGTITGDDVTIVMSQGSGSNNACWNSNGHIRIYGGNTLTFTSEKTITKIELTFTGTSNTGTLGADVGTYALDSTTGTWTGSASSVVITNNASSGHARISSIKVTYAE